MSIHSFKKIYDGILDSTVWHEPGNARIVWMTLIFMCDMHGRVGSTIPGIAGRAIVPISDVEDALKLFQEPDHYSRTKEHEGRRIKAIDGGWQILNFSKYKNMRDLDGERESKRIWAEKSRAKKKLPERPKSP